MRLITGDHPIWTGHGLINGGDWISAVPEAQAAHLFFSPATGRFAKAGRPVPFDQMGTFARAGGAFQEQADGDLVALGADVPRLADYSGGARGWLKEGAATNLIDGAGQMVTQTQAVSAIEQTLAFYGAGSVTLSGTHSATLAGTGPTDRVSLTFTPSAGDLTLTVSGDVRYPMMQAGPYASSPIVGPAGSSRAEGTAELDIAPFAGQIESFWALIDFEHLAAGTGFDRIWQFGNNDARWSLEYWSGVGELRFYQYAGGSPVSVIGYSTTPGVRHRAAVRMGNGTARMFVDDTDVGSAAAAGLVTPTRAWLGGSSSNGNVPAALKIHKAILSTSITESEAQEWTAA